MINVQLEVDAILIKWVQALLSDGQQPWKAFVEYSLRQCFTPFITFPSTIFSMSLPTNNKSVRYRKLSPLWHSVLNAWYRLHGRLAPSPSPTTLLRSPI